MNFWEINFLSLVSNSKHIDLNQTETDQYVLNINMYKIVWDCTIRLYPIFLFFWEIDPKSGKT